MSLENVISERSLSQCNCAFMQKLVELFLNLLFFIIFDYILSRLQQKRVFPLFDNHLCLCADKWRPFH